MSVQAPLIPGLVQTPPPARRKWTLPIVAGLLVLLFLGAGWYYFLGRKAKVAMSVALTANPAMYGQAMWAAWPGQLLVYAGGEVKLVDVSGRKEKWSVKMPAAPVVDLERQAAVNARFVKLQQWADELARKRAKLTTAGATKAFNAEAASYHAELAAARAEAANPRAVAPRSPAPAPARPPTAQPGSVRPGLAEPRKVVDAEVQILEERVRKRTAKLDGWRKTLDSKKASAKSELQKAAAKEEEARYAAEMADQKREQDQLAKAKGAVAPAAAAAPAAPEPEAAVDSSARLGGMSEPVAAICGDRSWIVEDQHAVAFDRASGAVKADVRLAGPARAVFSHGDTVIIIASATDTAEQVTKLTSAAAPQSFYVPVGRREYAFVSSEGATVPNVQNERTEFSGGGGSLLRADIRLKEKSIKVRDAIKSGSDKELETAADSSAAHSQDEIKAISALIANDMARLAGDDKERIDESTYEITLRRPFEPAVPEWKGVVKGRALLFSTPTVDLVTAGTKLLAFDRANKKAWEATLGAPVPIRRSDEEWNSKSPPWLEADGRLFFADGAFLNAFQANNGQVLWRIPSVGIRKLQIDGDGNLYVLSDNLPVETLTYVMDGSLRETTPLTMKIGAADGKIRWQAEKYEDLWVSGKDVYVYRETKNPGDVENQVFDPKKAIEARVKIYKLSRGSGQPMWEWFQARRPHAVEVDRKYVSLLFGNEVQIIHSICW